MFANVQIFLLLCSQKNIPHIMYGIVNKAIQELIETQYGINTWEKVRNNARIEDEIFLSNQVYDDTVTFTLATSAAMVLSISLESFLIALGEYWILETGQRHYNHYMIAGGANLKEFLINLPHFHTRIKLIYNELRPPEFEISDIKENSLRIHYFSTRTGLTQFVVGLLYGVGKMFNQEIKVMVESVEQDGNIHDVFLINW